MWLRMFSRGKRENENLSTMLILSTSIIFLSCLPRNILAQINSGSGGSRNNPSNYKDALLVYPTGIRSERDLPVCPSLIEEEKKDTVDFSLSSGVSSSAGNDANKLQQPGSTRNPSDSKKSDGSKEIPKKYLSACNIINRRYFYPPMIERLCRCPDRTECPMQWSQPPSYKEMLDSSRKDNNDASMKQGGSRTPTEATTQSEKSDPVMDPFTVMISSRTQLKFCAEVAANLPSCDKPPSTKHQKDNTAEENASMVKTVRKTFLAPELTSITLNCYCPPLYRGWTFLSKVEPVDLANATVATGVGAAPEKNYFYRCDKLKKCTPLQQCASIRTDYHYSHYKCACGEKQICVPKIYPPESTDDVMDEVEEALYSGQVTPAFCRPEDENDNGKNNLYTKLCGCMQKNN